MNMLFKLIEILNDANIHFELSMYRRDFVMILASVPGERWEIEVSKHGDVEFEIFVSNGEICGLGDLEKRMSRFAD